MFDFAVEELMLILHFNVCMTCHVDSDPDNLSCRSTNESSEELSASASITTDAHLGTKLKEYEHVIRQQQELLLQVIILSILCVHQMIIIYT